MSRPRFRVFIVMERRMLRPPKLSQKSGVNIPRICILYIYNIYICICLEVSTAIWYVCIHGPFEHSVCDSLVLASCIQTSQTRCMCRCNHGRPSLRHAPGQNKSRYRKPSGPQNGRSRSCWTDPRPSRCLCVLAETILDRCCGGRGSKQYFHRSVSATPALAAAYRPHF